MKGIEGSSLLCWAHASGRSMLLGFDEKLVERLTREADWRVGRNGFKQFQAAP